MEVHMRATDEVGRRGEDIAARELVSLGWSVLARNWRPPRGTGLRGEIDIVARDGGDLVVVEVKTRQSRTFGRAAEAVTRAKVARLRRLAAAWLDTQDSRFAGVRIDVVTVESGDGPPVVELLRCVE
jgi:putative endonuclease